MTERCQHAHPWYFGLGPCAKAPKHKGPHRWKLPFKGA